MVEPLRHRQTKGAATDMFFLTPPRHISTLPIMLKKSLLADERKFLGPLMRLVRGDVKGTTLIHPKSITDLRSGPKERWSGREV
jgi:hypothetical protein